MDALRVRVFRATLSGTADPAEAREKDTSMGTILIDKLLHTVVNQGASDLHIAVGQPPVVRLHGRMRKLETKVLTSEDTVALMKSIAPDRCQTELQEMGGSDFGFAFGAAARFRVSIFKQKGNVGMVLRQIPNKFLSMEQLGLPKVCKELIMRPRGLFLVTGPTGSGKSTSLASMINYLNETVDHHIITIEDPIEFYHNHKLSTVNQREVGVDVPSFAEAIRRALRQDPDVILVGEMRDLETIEAAITAAETGHVVFGTLAHHRRPRHGQPHHRRLSDQSAGPDPHAVVDLHHRHPVAGVDPQDRRRPRGGLRDAGGHAGHRQPDSRKQDVPHQLVDSDRRQVRHAVAGRPHLPPLEGRQHQQRRRHGQIEQTRRSLPRASPAPSAACSTTKKATETRTTMNKVRLRESQVGKSHVPSVEG